MNTTRSPVAALACILVPFVALTCLLFSSPAVAAGGNPFVCRDLAAERQTLTREATVRDLNFMLFKAAKSGCTELMEQLLVAGAAVEARDRFANTPLTLAAAAGQDAAIALLLDAGARIDHRNLEGNSPLLRAAMDNRRRTAVLLLERGADPNLGNGKSLTPLHAAAYNGNDDLVQALLAHGAAADVVDATGKSPAIYAAARGYGEIVGQLLDFGVDPARRYGNDLTLLMWAAGHSNDTPRQDGLHTVARILEAGPEIDAVDNRGWSALMIAAERGHLEIAELLLDRGADPTIADKQGRRAVELAVDGALQARLRAVTP